MVKKPRRPHDPWNSLNRLLKHWILDEDRMPRMVDIDEWLARDNRDNRVAETETATMRVSTVFLHGVDHNFTSKGPPILFETMVFTLDEFPRELDGKIHFSPDDIEQRRYSTWDDAEAGHNAIVRRIQKAEADALAKLKMKGAPK